MNLKKHFKERSPLSRTAGGEIGAIGKKMAITIYHQVEKMPHTVWL